MRLSDVYRNLMLTVIAALLAVLAFQGGTTSVSAQGASHMVHLINGTSVSPSPAISTTPVPISGQVKGMWCTSPNDCYVITQ